MQEGAHCRKVNSTGRLCTAGRTVVFSGFDWQELLLHAAAPVQLLVTMKSFRRTQFELTWEEIIRLNMNIGNKTFAEFVCELSSSAPVPGGGGASAAAGALASALVSMVANLTVGKKKYAAYEEDMQRIRAEAARLSDQLIRLADADAEAFAPLAEAYRLPQTTDQEKQHREEVMKAVLWNASNVPLRIMETVAEVIDLTAEAAEKGSRMAVSDAGVAAVFAQAALKGASLNIFINTKSMKDRTAAEELNARAAALIAEGQEKTDRIFQQILSDLRS